MNDEYEMILYVSKTAGNTVRFPLHQHPYWEILCYTKGKGQLLLGDGRKIPFGERTIICVPPQLDHGSMSDQVFENICIIDPGFTYDELYPELSVHPIVNSDNETGDLTALFNIIYRTYVNDVPNAFTLILHLMQSVYDLLKIRLQSDQSEKTCVSELRSYLNENFTNPACNISDAIAECGYTDSYLRGEFKRSTGITPGKYLRLLRLKNAEYLLTSRNSTETIAEIAFRSGFSDALYFSKAFQSAYHLPPSEYRRMNTIRDSEKIKNL